MNGTLRAVLAALLVGAAGCSGRGTDTSQNLPAPFFSTEPITQPRPYAEGVLSTVNGLAFAPDGRTVYVSRWIDERDERGRRRVRVFAHTFAGGQWSAPESVSFSREFTDYQAVLSPDGARLFFTSTRPIPGSDTEVRQNIWVVERAGDDWGTPRIVDSLVTPGWDGYAVATRTGRLYFVSERDGGRGAVDIWRADPGASGRYGDPVNVIALNSPDSDSDIFVDPDERYIVFHRSVEATGDIQFWIAFRPASQWLPPRLLDEVNGPGWELSPTVSPDGRYFFFKRDSVIHQVDFCALIRPDERGVLPGAC